MLRPLRRRPRAPALLVGALLLTTCQGRESETDVAQLIPPVRAEGRALQVVLHEVIEQSPRGGAVRVCRALAGRPVELQTGSPEPLGDLLERLADEVGTEVAPAARGRSGPALPTLLCPGVGEYLVIGRRPPG